MPPPILTNVEAEDAALGACLIDPGAIPRVFHLAPPDAFSDQGNAWIMAALATLFQAGAAVDILTVSEMLRRKDQLDQVGGLARLSSLINQTPSSIGADTYARIVADCADRRALLLGATDLARIAQDQSRDARPRAHAVCSEILGRSSRAGAPSGAMVDVLPQTFAQIEKWRADPLGPGEVRGLSTGLAGVDRMLGGLEPSLIICGGQTSIGKTAFSLQLSMNIASKGHQVCYVSGEMPAVQLTGRMLSSVGQISWLDIKSGNLDDGQWEQLQSARTVIGEIPLWLDAGPATVGDICSLAYQRKAKEGLDFLVVDYLGCYVLRSGENRPLELGAASSSLLRLSQELGVCVFVNHQLRRNSEPGKKNRRPCKEDLQWSGMLAQDADIVLLLWREALAVTDAKGRPSPKGRRMEIICDKNRLTGRVGRTFAYFGEYAEIRDGTGPGDDTSEGPESQEEIPF